MNCLKAYAQLMRIPNVFTAMADVWMGGLVTVLLIQPGGAMDAALWFLGPTLISAALYLAGMVLNDFFDVEEDRRDRPFRPIPSGRVPRARAGLIGAGLLAAGIVMAGLQTAWIHSRQGLQSPWWQPLTVAAAIAVCVLIYDAWLKRTWAGPVGMGACRLLNVLLGMSVSGRLPEPWMWQAAASVGIYIAGVTWFARTEAAISRRPMLIGAAVVMVMGIMIGFLLPWWWGERVRPELTFFPYLMGAWMVVVGGPIVDAIRKPDPQRVQAAIKRCILGLIGLDALLAFAMVGWFGLGILILLIPALWLGRWVYST